jgi:hypothetical protein
MIRMCVISSPGRHGPCKCLLLPVVSAERHTVPDQPLSREIRVLCRKTVDATFDIRGIVEPSIRAAADSSAASSRGTHVNFGLLESFRNSDRNEFSYSELYRRHLDLAVEAEELGYDTIWLTEHHFVEDGYSPAMMPLGAAIATRTKKIRIGTFVLLMPLHHPLHVAEQAVTLDVIVQRALRPRSGAGLPPAGVRGLQHLACRTRLAAARRRRDNPARTQ